MGLSLYALMRFRTHFHLRLLLAPTLGLSVTLLALFTLSRIRFPIKAVAMPVFLAGLVLSGYFLLTQRQIRKRKTFLLFGLAIVAALIPFTWPLLKFGFEWLAFVNGDMSYYSTSSTRLLNYGYSQLPISGNIYDIKDHSLMTWSYHNTMSYRTGADLLLAYLVGATGLTAHQVYMPLIIAFNFCVMAGAGALSLLAIRKWSFALWTMALLALSPMLTIEVTMQQLAQAIGLAALTSLCVSYTKVMTGSQLRPWGPICTVVFSFSTLALSYFEIIPFFVLYVLVFEAARWRKWTDATTRTAYIRTVAITACGIVLILNRYLFSTVERIVFAAQVSFENSAMTMHADGVSVFPYFFLPINGALLWGWMPLSGQANSLVVVLGLLATVLFIGALFAPRIRRLPSAQMTTVMLLVAVAMWIGGNGYGLFKIAMFIQPFLLPTLAAIVALFVTRRLFQRLSLAFLCLSFVPAQQINIWRVSEDVGSSPVAYASSAQLGRQLRELRSKVQTFQAAKEIKVFSDTPSVELFNLEAYYFRGIPFDDLARALFLLSVGEPKTFAFSSGVLVDFRSKEYTRDPYEYLLTTTGEFSVVNRAGASRGRLLQMRPVREFTDHLVLLESSIGAGRLSTNVASYQLERDPLFPGNTMSAVGQYHVYEILGPIEGSRVELSLSASYSKQEDFRIPAARVAGEVDVTLPVVGRGSARLISVPLKPRQIDSSDYMGIDFGRPGALIDPERKGPMTLFSQNVKLDIRRVVLWARDISYISPSQYVALTRPKAIQAFPSALEDRGLEYSGIFEDGWISDAAYVVLQSSRDSGKRSLFVSGLIPDINGAPFSAVVTIKVNDEVVYTGKHAKGVVSITVPLDHASVNGESMAKVQIESSAFQRLPNGDNRPVSMHIDKIGFK